METNKNNKYNDNIDDNTDIYLDVTDEEFLYIINLNLPSFLIHNKYVYDRIKTIHKIY